MHPTRIAIAGTSAGASTTAGAAEGGGGVDDDDQRATGVGVDVDEARIFRGEENRAAVAGAVVQAVKPQTPLSRRQQILIPLRMATNEDQTEEQQEQKEWRGW